MKRVGPLASFRLRMALLAGSLTAVFVVLASLLLLDLTYRFNLDTIDSTIDRIGRSNLERESGQAYWRRLDESLSVLGGDSDKHRYMIYVSNADRSVYRSLLWPKGVDARRKSALARIEIGSGSPPIQPRRGEPVSQTNPALPVLGVTFETVVDVGGGNWRMGVFRNHYQSLAIAMDMAVFEKSMVTLRNHFLVVLPFALLGVGGMAWWFAQRSLKPVKRLTDAVENVHASGLDYRVDLERYDPEYKRLAMMFNEMLERLESSFSQASRFSSDASHELKTPLSRLQMELEDALVSAPEKSEQQAVYSNLLDEIGRLKDIAHKLSLLSLSDAGSLPLNREKLDFGGLVQGTMEDWEVMVPGRELKVESLEGVLVEVDALLIEQAIQNLMSNAVKYGRPESPIGVVLRVEKGRALLAISNEGDSIPAGDRELIFGRFFRSDEARGVAVGGSGLGLSLSREIARAHGGEILVERSDGDKTVFVLEIPLSGSVLD